MITGEGVCLNSPEVIRLRHWGDETVVFDSNSGQTHLLAQPAGLLLSTLCTGPQSETDLQSLIANISGVSDEDAAAYVRDTLQSLQSLGLLSITAVAE